MYFFAHNFNVCSTKPCLLQFGNRTIPWEYKISTIKGRICIDKSRKNAGIYRTNKNENSETISAHCFFMHK